MSIVEKKETSREKGGMCGEATKGAPTRPVHSIKRKAQEGERRLRRVEEEKVTRVEEAGIARGFSCFLF